MRRKSDTNWYRISFSKGSRKPHEDLHAMFPQLSQAILEAW